MIMKGAWKWAGHAQKILHSQSGSLQGLCGAVTHLKIVIALLCLELQAREESLDSVKG